VDTVKWLKYVAAVVGAVITSFFKLLNRVKAVSIAIGVTIIGTVIANLFTAILINHYFPLAA